MRMKPCHSSPMTSQMTRVFVKRSIPHTKPSYLREENKNVYCSVFGTGMPWHRLPVLCWTGLASLLASPRHRHRIHRLFRYRVFVEIGAGGLAHCRNPAFHFPRHCQELINEKSPKFGRFFLFNLPIDKHPYLWYTRPSAHGPGARNFHYTSCQQFCQQAN